MKRHDPPTTTPGTTPPLPGMEDGSGLPGRPVSARMLAELAAVGAGAEAARALQFIPPAGREAVHSFFLHFYSSARAEILPTLERLAGEVIRAKCNLPLGGISLVGHARCNVPGFTLGNDLAVFYIVALRRKRPDFAPYLEHTATLAGLLHRTGWNPFADGAQRKRSKA